MKPWLGLGVVVTALGACLGALYLSGALVLWSLNLPVTGLRPGLVFDYWAALDLPAAKPYATRIRRWTIIGCALPGLLWAEIMRRCWQALRRWREMNPPPIAPFVRASDINAPWQSDAGHGIALTRYRAIARAALPEASVLVAGRDHSRALDRAVIPTLATLRGPVLVVDAGHRSHARTATWRMARGQRVVRIAPFGGGQPWNALRHAWRPSGLCDEALRDMAACWYPTRHKRDEFIASHVRAAFVGLVRALDDTLRDAGSGARDTTVTPGDVWRLCDPTARDTDRPYLAALTARTAPGGAARRALNEWLALDDAHMAEVWHRLREPLAIFSDVAVDGAARGDGLADIDLHEATIYLDIPDRRRHDAILLVETFITQWCERVARSPRQPLLIVHGLETLPPLSCLTRSASDVRCLATVRNLDLLEPVYGRDTASLLRRFALCVLHAPCDVDHARREAPVLRQFMAAHSKDGRALHEPATVDALMTLRDGEQIVLSAALERPLRCRAVASRRASLPPPAEHLQGEPMPLPKPLAAVFASLVAACSSPQPGANGAARAEADGPCAIAPKWVDVRGKPVDACLGPHKFRLPMNLFNGQAGQGRDKTTFNLAVQWPTLEPLPYGVDFHDANETFLASVRIKISHLDRRTDEDYPNVLSYAIRPIDPDDPSERLDLRIKGEPMYGLTPYYADFVKIRSYAHAVYSPTSPAARPEMNDDWFLQMNANGAPSTFIACSSYLIGDGVRVVDGRIVDHPDRGRRASCQHEFLIPKYKAAVTVDYMRVALPEWQRIEAYVRAVLEQHETE